MIAKIVSSRLVTNSVFNCLFLRAYLLLASLVIFAGFSHASDSLVLGVSEFENRALKEFPLLLEKSTAVEKTELELKSLKAKIILPKFEVRSLMGRKKNYSKCQTDTKKLGKRQ